MKHNSLAIIIIISVLSNIIMIIFIILVIIFFFFIFVLQVRRIFVGGLSSDTSEEDMRDFFEQFGEVSGRIQ